MNVIKVSKTITTHCSFNITIQPPEDCISILIRQSDFFLMDINEAATDAMKSNLRELYLFMPWRSLQLCDYTKTNRCTNFLVYTQLNMLIFYCHAERK